MHSQTPLVVCWGMGSTGMLAACESAALSPSLSSPPMLVANYLSPSGFAVDCMTSVPSLKTNFTRVNLNRLP
jgi:hypothetical protein